MRCDNPKLVQAALLNGSTCLDEINLESSKHLICNTSSGSGADKACSNFSRFEGLFLADFATSGLTSFSDPAHHRLGDIFILIDNNNINNKDHYEYIWF